MRPTPDSFTHHASRGDDLDARMLRVQARLLDSIEATLDELASPALRRDAIARAVRAQVAPHFCRRVTCRRAQQCRRKPCTVALRDADEGA